MYAQNLTARNLLQPELLYCVPSICSSRSALLGFLNNMLQPGRSSNTALTAQGCGDLKGYFAINSHHFQYSGQALKFPVECWFTNYVWSNSWRVKPSISIQTRDLTQNFTRLLSDNRTIFRIFGYQENTCIIISMLLPQWWKACLLWICSCMLIIPENSHHHRMTTVKEFYVTCDIYHTFVLTSLSH